MSRFVDGRPVGVQWGPPLFFRLPEDPSRLRLFVVRGGGLTTWPERAKDPGDRFGCKGSATRTLDHRYGPDGRCIFCTRLLVLNAYERVVFDGSPRCDHPAR